MQERWNAIERAFTARGLAPSALFQQSATEDDLRRLQSVTSLTLPPAVAAFYRIHNGQCLGIRGVLFGIELLSMDRMIDQWRNWEAVANDGLNEDLAGSMSSNPPDYIRPLYCNLRWLPLTHDQGGNHLGIDFDPAAKGTIGQIIAFGRDFDEKKLIAPSFEQFVEMIIGELNTIDWALDLKSGWRINDSLRNAAHYYDWPRVVRK